MAGRFTKWLCTGCGYIYDPAIGDKKGGIPPGIPFDDLPEDWHCPDCGAPKDMFVRWKDPSVRMERAVDHARVFEILEAAFGRKDEALLVKRLRESPDFRPELSLVAEHEGKVVGHVMLFPIKIEDGERHHVSLALAPVSVAPGYQLRGFGTRLVNEALNSALDLGFGSAIVLGHPDYYQRLGFSPAEGWGITAPFDVPPGALMAIELRQGGLTGISGVVEYPGEFGAA